MLDKANATDYKFSLANGPLSAIVLANTIANIKELFNEKNSIITIYLFCGNDGTCPAHHTIIQQCVAL